MLSSSHTSTNGFSFGFTTKFSFPYVCIDSQSCHRYYFIIGSSPALSLYASSLTRWLHSLTEAKPELRAFTSFI